MRPTFNPKNAVDPVQNAAAEISKYLELHSGSNVEDILCKPSGNALVVMVKADSEYKYLLHPVNRAADRLLYNGGGQLDGGSGLYSFEELKTVELHRPEPIIEDLVFQGETVLIAGRPKVGKSRLVHQMAFSIEGGTPFLGMAVPHKRSVLVVDLENKPWALKDRLVARSGISTAPGLYVWTANSISENIINSSPDGIDRLKGIILQIGAEVLVIDPWRLWLGKDENDALEVVRGLRALSSLRESYPRLTIIIIHHVRKERFDSPRKLLEDPRLWVESISGHHALISHVDSCYWLERQLRDEQDGEEWIVFGGIARNTNPRTIVLEDDEVTLRFDVCRMEAALEAVLTKAEKGIWATAKETAQFGFNELVKAAKTTNRKAVTAALRKAQAHGLVTRTGERYEVRAEA